MSHKESDMTEHLSKDYRIYSPSYLLQQWFYIAYQRQDNRMEKLGKYRFQYLLLHFAHCIFYMSVRIGPTFLLVLLSCLFVSHIEVHQASSSFTISWSLLKTMSTASVMPSSHLIVCCPLFFLSSMFLSIRDFSNELSFCPWWPKYRGFSFRISASNEFSKFISLKIGLLDILTVQGTLRSLHHHSLKVMILWGSHSHMQ